MQKAGSILVNEDFTKVCLVYRKKHKDYSFPKGHIEKNETLLECALRETEEETNIVATPIKNESIGSIKYINHEGQIELVMFLLQFVSESNKQFTEEEIEEPIWIDIDTVEDKLSYDNLKEFWKSIKNELKR